MYWRGNGYAALLVPGDTGLIRPTELESLQHVESAVARGRGYKATESSVEVYARSGSGFE